MSSRSAKKTTLRSLIASAAILAQPLDQREATAELIRADGKVHPYKGRFLAADRQVDAKTGTIRISAIFPNPGNILRPGQYARLRTQNRRNALARCSSRNERCWSCKAETLSGWWTMRIRYRSIKVTVGPRFGSDWIIEEGLKPGERIVVEGLQKVRDGATVQPATAPPTAGCGSRSQKPPRSSALWLNSLSAVPSSRWSSPSSQSLSDWSRLSRLPIAEYPQVSPTLIEVTANYRGAAAEAVMDSVATPIESKVNGVDKMLYMQSFSANDGKMVLKVTFDVGTNVDIMQVNTQNRVSMATAQLPDAVKREGVTVNRSSPDLLMVLGLYSPKGTYDAVFLGNYADINLVDAIKRVSGVGDVKNFTAQDYSMRVWLQPNKMAALGITPEDIANAIREQNAQTPAGVIGAEPAPKGQEKQYNVRALGLLTDAKQFEQIIVRSNSDGSQVKIKDVARVELGAQTYALRARLNQAPAAALGVYLAPGANALQAADQIKRILKEREERFPPDMKYETTLDFTAPIKASMHEIEHTLIEAIILVLIVVYLFLQSFRATIIPMLTVPVSLLGAFIAFPLLGFSVNTLTLFGLVLAIGIVVDDAIVVVEAVQHHLEHGLSPREATVQAMKEVSGPVIMIALILCAVFVPVAFMGGVTGQLYQQFAITVAVAVVFSAINALTLSPALCALLLKKPKPARGPLGWFFGQFNRGFDRVTSGYGGVVHFLIRKAGRSILLLVVVVGAIWLLSKSVPGGFIPDEDKGLLFVAIELPEGASLQRSDEVLKKAEQIVAETKGVRSVCAISGYNILTGLNMSNSALMFRRTRRLEKTRMHPSCMPLRLRERGIRNSPPIPRHASSPSVHRRSLATETWPDLPCNCRIAREVRSITWRRRCSDSLPRHPNARRSGA